MTHQTTKDAKQYRKRQLSRIRYTSILNYNKEISIFSNGGHLGYRTALRDTILKGNHLRIISAKFGGDWLSSIHTQMLWYTSTGSTVSYT
jgi:hypothetical protein